MSLPDLLSVVVRALAFIALFQAAGAALFYALFGRAAAATRARQQQLALYAAIAAVVLVAGHVVLETTRMAGAFGGIWDLDLQRLAWSTSAGHSQIVQIIGLLLIVGAFALRPAATPGSVTGAVSGIAGAVIAVAAFLLTGHTSDSPLRFVLAPLLALHLLIVAFWFGALLPLILVVRLETAATASQILRRFSSLAGILVPLIALAGLAMAAILCGSFSVLRRPYGQLLLVKLGLFIVLLVLAAYNRWRLVPALAQQQPAAMRLRRSMRAEYLLIVAVLSVTAVLTAFFSPR